MPIAPIAPPAPLPPAQLDTPPPPPPAFPLLLVIPFLCLLGALFTGLGSVLAVELQSQTPIVLATAIRQTATPTVTPTVASPTPAPTFTLTPTPVPNAEMLLAFVSNPIGPDRNKDWTAWPGQFGLRTADNKPLTFRLERTGDVPDGRTNNTRVWVDGPGASFGSTGPDTEMGEGPTQSEDGRKLTMTWKYKKVVFSQVVELVLNPYTYKYDTYRIIYSANNQDDVDHDVNVRLMLDTMIGENDGTSFSIAGTNQVITKTREILGTDVDTDYYQLMVLENSDLSNPGVVAMLTLNGNGTTIPGKVEITPWCNSKDEPAWYYMEAFGAQKDADGLHQCGDPKRKLDTALGIFFISQKIKPGESAQWVTSYGLGEINKPKPVPVGQTSMSFQVAPKQVQIGDEFYLTALINNPKPGQAVELSLPPQLVLSDGTAKIELTQTNVAITQVSWKVKAVKEGTAQVTAKLTPDNLSADVSTNVTVILTPTPTLTPTPCIPSPFNRCFITPSAAPNAPAATPTATGTPKP